MKNTSHIRKQVGFTYRYLAGVIKRWYNQISPNPETYGIIDLSKRERFRDEYTIVASGLIRLLSFDNVIDVGCGQGFLLDPLKNGGIDVYGIEKSEAAKRLMNDDLEKCVKVGDFSKAAGDFDLVCCVEVAEHIKPHRSIELVDTLTSVSKRYIYFTAATPEQGGHGHINCRPHEYWLKAFTEQGFVVDEKNTHDLRKELSRLKKATWLEKNSFILKKIN